MEHYPAYGDLVFDQAGNIYGTTWAGGGTGCGGYGGGSGCGTVFNLMPSNGGWTESVLYSFTGGNDGGNPLAGVIFDRVGNLYGPGTTGAPTAVARSTN